jgi:hypothetical protein
MFRMGNIRFPRKILFGELVRAGVRGRGRLKQKVAMYTNKIFMKWQLPDWFQSQGAKLV